MPQSFHILRCYSCSVFQVHIVKKSSKKWECKMCGAKQTLKKVYGEGAAHQCREIVQKLNMNAASPDKDDCEQNYNIDQGVPAEDTGDRNPEGVVPARELPYGKRKLVVEPSHRGSKWAKFLTSNDPKWDSKDPVPTQVSGPSAQSVIQGEVQTSSSQELLSNDNRTKTARASTWLRLPTESDEQVDELLNWDL